MELDAIIDKLRKGRSQARQRHPNAEVVKWEDAVKAVTAAYSAGLGAYTAALTAEPEGKEDEDED